MNQEQLNKLEEQFRGAGEETQLTKTESTPPRFTVLRPVESSPDDCEITMAETPNHGLRWVRQNCTRDSIVAFDIENTFNDSALIL